MEFTIGFAIAAGIQNSFNTSMTSVGKTIKQLGTSTKEYQKTLKALAQAENNGIISHQNYAAAVAKISPEIEQLTKKQQRLKELQGDMALAKSQRSNAEGEILRFYLLGKAILEPVKSAMEFNKSMSEVKKTVHFDSPTQFKTMSKDILDLSAKIPVAKEQLINLVSIGGRTGVSKADLIGFAEAAAKMGTSFGIGADAAGQSMARWRKSFQMTQPEVNLLADKIKYLGNTTAAAAPSIADVVTKIGPLGAVGGVASGEIAALSASMISSGAESDKAAAGIKELILTMTAGSTATKSQQEAFANLGLSAQDMAAMMQKDAKGAIMTVMQSIQKLDKVQQASTLKELFGKKNLGSIAPLLTDLKGLQDNFAKVGDQAKYAGTINQEYAERSKTVGNSMQLLKNQVEKTKIELGSGLLPVISPIIMGLAKAGMAVGNFASSFPRLSTGIMAAGLAVVGLGLAINGINWVVSSAKIGITALKLAMTSFNTVTKISSILAKGFAIAQHLVNVAMLACPIGWLIVGVAALVVAGTLLYRHWSTIKQFFTNLWASPTAKLIMFCTGPIGWLIAAGVALIANWEAVKSWFTLLWNNPKAALDQFIAGIYAKFNEAYEWLQQKWEGIKNFLSQPIFGSVNITTNEHIAHNATGGIYGKGAFLTTFAENSGESAIPHTPTRRNIDLLAKTNAIMGNPLGGSVIQADYNPTFYITTSDPGPVRKELDDSREKFRAMLEDLAHEQRRRAYD